MLDGAWLIVGPLVRGPLDQEQIKWISRWEMFGLYGRGICDVRYVQHHADGELTRVDWIELLGRSRDWDKRRRNRIKSNTDAFRIMAPSWLVAFGLLTLGASFFMLIGFMMRLSTGITAICGLAIGFGLNSWAGWQSASFSHHEACLAMCVAMVALQPTGGSYSVDRWLTVRRAEKNGDPIPPEEGDLWAWPLLGIALSCVYSYGALIKCHWGYFNGDRLEQVVMYKYLGSELPRNIWFQSAMVVSAVGSVLLEFGLCFGLWFKRFRWHLVIAGTIFHLLIYATMTVYTFSLTMIFMYLAYFPVESVHHTIDRLQSSGQRASA